MAAPPKDQEKAMSTPYQLHRPNPLHDDEDDPEPGLPPIEPGEGPAPPIIEPDPEHERVVDPEV